MTLTSITKANFGARVPYLEAWNLGDILWTFPNPSRSISEHKTSRDLAHAPHKYTRAQTNSDFCIQIFCNGNTPNILFLYYQVIMMYATHYFDTKIKGNYVRLKIFETNVQISIR